MKGRTSVLILLAALGCVASWLLGYHEGQRTGAFQLLRETGESYRDMDRDQVCDEIRRYKLSMARELDENTQICGWSDMDGPEKSN